MRVVLLLCVITLAVRAVKHGARPAGRRNANGRIVFKIPDSDGEVSDFSDDDVDLGGVIPSMGRGVVVRDSDSDSESSVDDEEDIRQQRLQAKQQSETAEAKAALAVNEAQEFNIPRVYGDTHQYIDEFNPEIGHGKSSGVKSALLRKIPELPATVKIDAKHSVGPIPEIKSSHRPVTARCSLTPGFPEGTTLSDKAERRSYFDKIMNDESKHTAEQMSTLDASGQTMLHKAVLFNALDAIPTILALTKNVDIPNGNGQTAFELAVCLSYSAVASQPASEAAMLLIRYGSTVPDLVQPIGSTSPLFSSSVKNSMLANMIRVKLAEQHTLETKKNKGRFSKVMSSIGKKVFGKKKKAVVADEKSVYQPTPSAEAMNNAKFVPLKPLQDIRGDLDKNLESLAPIKEEEVAAPSGGSHTESMVMKRRGQFESKNDFKPESSAIGSSGTGASISVAERIKAAEARKNKA